MRELSLFTGAGGGVLGSKLLGWETIGYVEYEEYCQKVLKQRIADGILDAAPIFGDLAESGYNARWKMLSAWEVGAPHSRQRAWIVAYANSECGSDTQKRHSSLRLPCGLFKKETWERASEPVILGMDDGVAYRVDRLKAIGNGQVPAVVRTAWELLK